MLGLSALIATILPACMPNLAQAEYAEYLSSPGQRTLRNPIISGAPYSFYGQSPNQGQPPAIGDGFMPAGVVPGDLGSPHPIPSGMADRTHGNAFPAGQSGPPKSPWAYVPGAGRRGMINGQQQGMYEYGQGQVNGRGMFEGGAGNGGQGVYQNGIGNGGRGMFESGAGNGGQGTLQNGAGNGGRGMFESGAGNGGQGTFQNGAGNGGRSMFESGAGNGGQGTFQNGAGNGGRGMFESGAGNGGQANFQSGQGNGGRSMFESGSGNGGQGTFQSGQGNGGRGMFESGSGNGGQANFQSGKGNGGRGMFESGSGNGGQGTYQSGDGNGGRGMFESGSGNRGQATYQSGKGNGGRGMFESGAGNGGQGTFQGDQGNGGRQEIDRDFQHQKEASRFFFQGPLPTVKTFSRYLVLLGVVMATIFVGLAGWSVVFGSQYGASRVIGAVGGLLLLLAGYTIWKIVRMNTMNANTTRYEAKYRDGSQMNVSPYRGQSPQQGNNGSPFGGAGDPGG
ncbi:MAG: hypothetical protein K2W82_02625 [Candidatus Obscuribacterales bacterium]|nr:hypothetical protein [Candidatus Obscuribacterales bacterium]